MHVRMVTMLAVSALVSTAWMSVGDPPPDGVFARPALLPVPASVTNQCRLAQATSNVAVLCPTVLPQASVAPMGTPTGAKPAAIKSFRAKFVRHGGLEVRLTFRYGGDEPSVSGSSWRARPCCYLHFEVITRTHRPFHLTGGRSMVLGGRKGTFVRAVGRDIIECDGGRAFGCNHIAFAWRQNGVFYAATLRSFGTDTTGLLARLVAGLRPAPRS
jgi:hypothetical protein